MKRFEFSIPEILEWKAAFRGVQNVKQKELPLNEILRFLKLISVLQFGETQNSGKDKRVSKDERILLKADQKNAWTNYRSLWKKDQQNEQVKIFKLIHQVR